MGKGAPVDVAEADEYQAVDGLRPDFDKGLQPSADKFQFSEGEPHEAAERGKAEFQQRCDASDEVPTITKLSTLSPGSQRRSRVKQACG